MKVFRSPRARRSPDARAAPTLRRDLRHAPLKRPCSRPGSYQRSSGVPVPGDNTPRIIDDRAGKSYRNRRPGPDHRGLPNMVMGSPPLQARTTQFHAKKWLSDIDTAIRTADRTPHSVKHISPLPLSQAWLHARIAKSPCGKLLDAPFPIPEDIPYAPSIRFPLLSL